MFVHHTNCTICSAVVLLKPKIEGCYEKEIVISSEFILLLNESIDLIKELSRSTIIEDRKYSSFWFQMSEFDTREIYYPASACKGSYNRCCPGKCFCLKKMNATSWIIGIKFDFTELEDARIKTYCSNKLVSQLLSKISQNMKRQ